MLVYTSFKSLVNNCWFAFGINSNQLTSTFKQVLFWLSTILSKNVLYTCCWGSWRHEFFTSFLENVWHCPGERRSGQLWSSRSSQIVSRTSQLLWIHRTLVWLLREDFLKPKMKNVSIFVSSNIINLKLNKISKC